MTTLSDAQKFTLRRQITDYAKSLGFDLTGFSPAKIEGKYLKGFEEWLAAGREGTMDYMRKIAQRRDMNLILPGAKTVIVFGLNYYHEQGRLKRGHGRIARYAYGRDYHKVIGKKLKKVEEFIARLYFKMWPMPIASALSKSARADFLAKEVACKSHLVSSCRPPGATAARREGHA